MGVIAESIIEGKICAICGVYLEPGEVVFVNQDPVDVFQVKMPEDGSGFGTPVECKDCHETL